MQERFLVNALFSGVLEHSKALDTITLNILAESARTKMQRSLELKRVRLISDILLDNIKGCDFKPCPATNHDSLLFTCTKCGKILCHRHIADIIEINPEGLGKGICQACLKNEKTFLSNRISYNMRYLISEIEHAHARGITTITKGYHLNEKVLFEDLIEAGIRDGIDSSIAMFLLNNDAEVKFIDFLLIFEHVKSFPKFQGILHERSIQREPELREPFDVFSILDDAIEVTSRGLSSHHFLRDLRKVFTEASYTRIMSALPSRSFDFTTSSITSAYGPRAIELVMKTLSSNVKKGLYLGSNPPRLFQDFVPSPGFTGICRSYQRFIRLLALWNAFHQAMIKDTIYDEIRHELQEDQLEFIQILGPASLLSGKLNRIAVKQLCDRITKSINDRINTLGISIDFTIKGNDFSLALTAAWDEVLRYE